MLPFNDRAEKSLIRYLTEKIDLCRRGSYSNSMATTPTQMRLTDQDKADLEQIRILNRLNNRTTTVRLLIWFYKNKTRLGPAKINRKNIL